MSQTTTTTKVRAPLEFYLQGGEGIESIHIPLSNKNEGHKFNTQHVDIEDVRGHETDFTLDENGFELLRAPTTFTDFHNSDAVTSHYYAEAEALLKTHLKATHAYAMGHALRSSTDPFPSTPPSTLEPPASFIHCDWSYRGAHLRLTEPLLPCPWEASHHPPNTPWAAYSLWRPLTPVTRDALALADKSTVSDADLQPLTTQFPTGAVNEAASLRFREGQRFVYWGGMQVGEVLLIKLFDSRTDGRARCAPHTAFKGEGDHGEARRSVECRVVVFWEGEEGGCSED
ncbi:hypothetical protein B0A48_16654 [Cryoendolithus antarcticus]|uniref:Uncharacterized protein n=1 Tax=Cryoendolithus antarcticus TaxID=1507870 RepID=A0A1V8SF90_9PEZI|nr:hypothetical protein B0A48_16654 [Cryoendolithus antarcticus]